MLRIRFRRGQPGRAEGTGSQDFAIRPSKGCRVLRIRLVLDGAQWTDDDLGSAVAKAAGCGGATGELIIYVKKLDLWLWLII